MKHFKICSVKVGKCLKLLLKNARTSFLYRIKEIDNCVFVIDNRDRVVNFMNKANQSKVKRKCISTWDFSTLYTKIPHIIPFLVLFSHGRYIDKPLLTVV